MKMKKTARLIMALVAAVLLLTACSKDPAQTDTSEPTSQEPLTATTPYCDLQFPGQWKEQIQTQYAEANDGGALTFSAQIGDKEAKLFTVLFSSHMDTDCAPVGVLTGGEAPVMVSLKIHDIESDTSLTDAEKETAFVMQDECNYLLEQLQARTDFDMNYEAYFAPEDPKIQTPFCTLSLPGKWADRIRWEFTPVDDGGNLDIFGEVAAEDALLFTLCFGTDREDAVLVGSLKTGGGLQSVSLVIAEPQETAHWTDADWDDYAAMQESINDLMASLTEDPDFVAP